ncbi:MAG: hypothetical protein HY049_05855 [Acidobacteria bacterium]|nr:hypothetical protein [Acidobacteriota bacterium]
MVTYRCPNASHKESPAHLRSNNDKVYECDASHRYFRRDDQGVPAFVDLISGQAFAAATLEEPRQGEAEAARARLNFMVDIPRTTPALDFNRTTLSPAEWKVISRMDGKSTIEEVRLLSGLKADEIEALVHRLIDLGLIEIRRRGR